MSKEKHTYSTIRFGGSVVLLLTVAGVLLAIGGQLDLLGTKRLDMPVKRATIEPKDAKSPKYSFYDELKKRKTELGKTLVSPQPVEKTTTPEAQGKIYFVQVGAFSKQSDANTLKKKVKSLGYPVKIIKTTKHYLTQAGPFKGMEKAKAVEKRLREQRLETLIKAAE